MHRTIGRLAAGWLALAGGAAAAQDNSDFCTELQRMMAGARETPTFASLEAAPPQLGFVGGGCIRVWADKAPAYRCHQTLSPPELSQERLVEQTRACLPDAVEVETDRYRARRLQYREYDIDIVETGTDRAHVGRSVSFEVTLRR